MTSSKHRVRDFVLALFAVTLLSGVGVLAYEDDDEDGEQKIALKQAPDAIRKALADVDVDEIEVEASGGKLIYEVVIEIDDVEIELELTADARLIGVEIEEDEDNDGDSDD